MSESRSFLERNHFWLRRLHSLTGLVPIGVFLIAHLITNSSLLWGTVSHHAVGDTLRDRGVYYFQDEVTWINEEIPHLILIEVTLWVSIAFHSVLGLVYALSGRANLTSYQYQSNWRYSLQRWSGYVGILFIFYHVATLRWGWDWLVPGGTKWSYEYSASTLAAALRGAEEGWTALGAAVGLLYFLGVTLLVFHFANGLWTSAITWGLTISAKAQRRWGYVCAGLGAGLMVAGWSALGMALTTDVGEARRVEQAMLDGTLKHSPDEPTGEELTGSAAAGVLDEPVGEPGSGAGGGSAGAAVDGSG